MRTDVGFRLDNLSCKILAVQPSNKNLPQKFSGNPEGPLAVEITFEFHGLEGKGANPEGGSTKKKGPTGLHRSAPTAIDDQAASDFPRACLLIFQCEKRYL